MKVLIVEDGTFFDNFSVRHCIIDSHTLKFMKQRMEKEALRKVEMLRPNLIFMEIRLPGKMA